jgi:hypothetical protein
MRVHIKFAVVDPKYELAWTGTALSTKAIERLVLERLSTTRLHLHESLAGAFATLFLDSVRLRGSISLCLPASNRLARPPQPPRHATQMAGLQMATLPEAIEFL